jgi:hydroxymethylbilane synthase
MMTSPHHRPLRLGTRGSPLARAQAGRIAQQLQEQCGRSSVLVTVATPGDESTAPIERLGTTGVFTTTLREALLRGTVDLVVHSCKDLPTAPVPGLQVAAFPAREDPRDALIWPGGTSLGALPPGTRIGTGSARRAAQLRAIGRELQIVPIRGNVGTRLRKLAHGEVDALVLAMAGLSRLGLLDAVATPLDPSLLMPAPAQGVLAVECRTDDLLTAAQVRTLDHAPTRAAAIAERSFLAALDAGCTAPVGALAELTAESEAEPAMCLSGLIAAPDGSSVIRARTTGAVGDGAELGRRLAQLLFRYGEAALLDRTLHGVTDLRHARPKEKGWRESMNSTSQVLLQRRRETEGTDWRDHAACRGMDPELFFPIGTSSASLLQIDEAKQICRTCPVRRPCLRWALENGDAGVWGGTSEDERRNYRQLPGPF